MDTGNPVDTSRAVSGRDIVREARKLIGVPYRHQGRNERGLDCVGLPLLAAHRAGAIDMSDARNDYTKMPQAELLEAIGDYMIETDEPVDGAVVLLKWPKALFASHCAIITDAAQYRDEAANIIHAYGSIGRVVEHRFAASWMRLLNSVWIIPGVSYT